MEYSVILSLKNASPLLFNGMLTTLTLWITALLCAVTVGIVWGIARCNQLRIPYFSQSLDAITFLLRGVPFYVQLLIAYYVIPDLLNINISAFNAAVFSLGLCSAAYVSQIVRGGINAIDQGQWEAAYVLGYSTIDTIRYVIIPQLIRIILPALTGECDQLLKSTAVISTIGVLELTGAGKNIITRELNPLTIYITIALIYLVMSSTLALCASYLERKLSYD